ncbi:hypothetical protein ES705_30955 [subsurface metagenome]
MNYMTSNEIRESFLKFFESKGHKITPSASLVPSDPSILLTIASNATLLSSTSVPNITMPDLILSLIKSPQFLKSLLSAASTFSDIIFTPLISFFLDSNLSTS